MTVSHRYPAENIYQRRISMAENREYKSDVFSMLMKNKEYALQVYNALNKIRNLN